MTIFFGCLGIQRFNYAYVILLIRKVNISNVSDFRLVNLLNETYKITIRLNVVLSSLLTIWLNVVLNSLVDSVHPGFVAGIYILDSVDIVQEVMLHGLDIKRNNVVLPKLAFAKAFDMVDWRFIFETWKLEILVIDGLDGLDWWKISNTY